MKQKDIISYVYDFISQITENKIIFEETRSIVLFGSIARGDFDEESDVDLFVDITHEKIQNKIHEQIKKELVSFELRCEKSWYLKGIRLPLKILVGDLQTPRWKDLKKEMESYGIILYGKFKNSALLVRHHALVNFDIVHLHQNQKMALLRELYGYSTTKEERIYKIAGILEKVQGIKLGANVLLVPFEQLLGVRAFFKKHKASYKIKSFWEK